MLSSFTGASRELSEALIVNPHHTKEMSLALDTALRMPANEQQERMRLMRQQVREWNVYRWAGRMLLMRGEPQRRRIFEISEAKQSALIQPIIAWSRGIRRQLLLWASRTSDLRTGPPS